MKTCVRCRARGAQRDTLLQRWQNDPEISAHLDSSLAVEVEVTDPLFEPLVRHTEGTGGAAFRPEHMFSAEETESARYLVLRPKSLLDSPDSVWRKNYAYIETLPIISRHPGYHRRQLDRLLVGRIRTSTKSAFAIESTCAFVITSEMADALDESGFTGWSTASLIHHTTHEEVRDWRLFVPTAVLPPLVKDSSLVPVDLRIEEAEEDYRRLGCLTYTTEEVDSFDDVNVTDEALWSWQGYTVVSAAVGAFLKKKRARVDLEPVLEAGSGLHRQYVDHWKLLTAVKEYCSENHVR